jgi:hypothetical protein
LKVSGEISNLSYLLVFEIKRIVLANSCDIFGCITTKGTSTVVCGVVLGKFRFHRTVAIFKTKRKASSLALVALGFSRKQKMESPQHSRQGDSGRRRNVLRLGWRDVVRQSTTRALVLIARTRGLWYRKFSEQRYCQSMGPLEVELCVHDAVLIGNPSLSSVRDPRLDPKGNKTGLNVRAEEGVVQEIKISVFVFTANKMWTTKPPKRPFLGGAAEHDQTTMVVRWFSGRPNELSRRGRA